MCTDKADGRRLPNELIEAILQLLPPLQMFQLATAFRFLRLQSSAIPLLPGATIDKAAAKGQVALLNWWKQNKLPFNYSRAALDNASRYGHVLVLDWWRESGLALKYSHRAVDWASANGHIAVLMWWDAHSRTRSSPSRLLTKGRSITFKYSSKSIDAAHSPDVLDWWCTCRLRHEFKQSFSRQVLSKASRTGNVQVLEWWKKSGFLDDRNEDIFEPLFTAQALDLASQNGFVGVLEWWVGSGFRFETSRQALLLASLNGHVEVLDWWRRSGLVDFELSEGEREMVLTECPPNVVEWWSSEAGVK
ncbi:hypothetical protein CcCBS67573_g04373 [Chytriomyces confervae]|uniref:F-box domain-containing protein n=1 Tax=Chytriomyces confervae TaxID=246404 RepID=A0A507FGE9_9FUNG|nr:hypothetical protein HDU80_008056 [Chytriomyces hyalinus]TPX74346.1 hypothetical protein CcCBS67573_g04373 [Chytriomyces confervae]